MARLQSLRPQVASLPSRLKSTFTLGKEQEAYGQGRGGRPWRRKRDAVLKRDGYLCQCESCQADDNVPLLADEVDHIVPIAEGGTDDMSNLQAQNRHCHKRKTKAEAARGVKRMRFHDNHRGGGSKV
jgi:5-methylcytosine-specific restriction protein A